MKKVYLTAIAVLFAIGIFAQSIVTTIPQMKNVILEEYTGVNCTYCPDGHKISHEIMTENLGRAFAINIHQGGYAETTPNYTTDFGDNLANQTGLQGYPSGTVNRHTFPGLSSAALARGQWSLASKLIMAEPSPVNVGIETSYNSTNRELTVNVEVFYTDASATSSNFLNVALVQNEVEGPQVGASTHNPDMLLPNGNYRHMHMLRHLITGQWGEEITTTTSGSLFTKTYTYTIPENYYTIPCIPTDCDIVAFISEGNQEIITGVQVAVSGGSNDGTTETYIGPLTNALTDIVGSADGETENFTLSGTSLLQGDEDFIYTLTTDAPGDWTADFTVDGTDYTGTATISMSNGIEKDVTINVNTGAIPGLATYTLEMKSASLPDAPVQKQSIYVISGVTDLIVNGSGGFGDGNDYNFDDIYDLALANTGCTTFAHTDAAIMEKGITNDAFNGVNNIYMNIAWTFPSFQDEEVNALTTFLDNGGNLFISGQDMGWDVMSGSEYASGTATAQNFYTNYLSANFSNDGATSNSQLQAIAGDAVFGNIASTTITDVYDGNMYPDQITPRDEAVSIFNYNGSSTKISGVRKNNGTYKVVYLSVGLEMLQDEAVRFAIINQSYKWFNGLIIEGTISAVNEISCNTGCDAEITVEVTDGAAPYTFLWDDGNNQTTQTATALCAGEYNVTITDDNDLTTVASFTVTEPEVLSATVNIVEATCPTCEDGTITASVNGDSGDYTYLWNDASNQTTQTAENLAAGEYAVTITDAVCNTSVVVGSIIITDVNGLSFEKLVNVYPNPANDNINIDFRSNDLNDIKVELMDILGNTLYSTMIDNTNEFRKSINIENHANGIYLLKISNGVNQTIKRIDIQK